MGQAARVRDVLQLGVDDEVPSFALFSEHIRAAGVDNRIHPIVARSDDAVVDWTDPIDFLFVDGWHSYDAVLADGRNWTPFLTPTGTIVFDDSYQYPEVGLAIRDLGTEGTLTVWGDAFGQTYCGAPGSGPSDAARFVLSSDRPWMRHVPWMRRVNPSGAVV